MELADRLPFCPRCIYPFTGLPEAHQCPECGLAYDGESRMWISHRRNAGERKAQLVGGGLNAIMGVALLIWLRNRMNDAWIVFTIIVIGVSNMVLGWRATLKRSHYLAILPDGIWYHTRSRQPRTLPWTQIRMADDDRRLIGPTVRIHLNPRGKLSVPRNLINTPEDAKDVAELIAARVSRRRP